MRIKVYIEYAFIPYYGWSINIYILNQPKFSKKETVVLERNLSRIMFLSQADSSIFLFVTSSLDLMAVLSPTSSLTTAFLRIPTRVRALLLLVYSMRESSGQRRLRLTKVRLANELRQRTENRVAELREQAGNRDTDIDHKGTQCTNWNSCINASLFCFLLVVLNLLLLQRLYTKGHIKFE